MTIQLIGDNIQLRCETEVLKMAKQKMAKEIKEKDEVIASILVNYDKLSSYNRGRLSMMAEMLREEFSEGQGKSNRRNPEGRRSQ